MCSTRYRLRVATYSHSGTVHGNCRSGASFDVALRSFSFLVAATAVTVTVVAIMAAAAVGSCSQFCGAPPLPAGVSTCGQSLLRYGSGAFPGAWAAAEGGRRKKAAANAPWQTMRSGLGGRQRRYCKLSMHWRRGAEVLPGTNRVTLAPCHTGTAGSTLHTQTEGSKPPGAPRKARALDYVPGSVRARQGAHLLLCRAPLLHGHRRCHGRCEHICLRLRRLRLSAARGLPRRLREARCLEAYDDGCEYS